MYIESLDSVNDLRKLNKKELSVFAEELREFIIEIISKNGGHLASSLGVIELTIALHYVFDTPIDRLIWDVGHQAYAHKIITGRRKSFHTIRKYKGLSGFPKACESVFDTYNCGHSSTSLSLAIGEAVARDLNKADYNVIAVIGDGSLTGGMSFEALNNIGDLNKDLIIILNDNEHSISKNVGALSEYLTRIISGNLYNSFRERSKNFFQKIPRIGRDISRIFYKTEANIKGILSQGQLFDELGIRYFGPIDGHNIGNLIKFFTRIKTIKGPKIAHLITKKGKGYLPAEGSPSGFHGVGPFEIKTGDIVKKTSITFSDIVGNTLIEIAKQDKKVIAITAAMVSGTGLTKFADEFPERIFDVGIAEQHAVTFAAALAQNKYLPFISIYSTFLQRGYDQLIHDVGIMNLPVKILIDRAGIVGDDGETHHGLFDISYIRNIPNFRFISPASGEELKDALYYAYQYDKGPIAIRFPRGIVLDYDKINYNEYKIDNFDKIKILKEGTEVTILALGDMVQNAIQTADLLEKNDISTSVVNILSIKPLDIEGIERVIKKCNYFITIENGYINGGIGEYIYRSIQSIFIDKCLFTAGFPDEFITQGSMQELYDLYSLSADKIFKRIINAINKKDDEK